jgi:hypothetical protein
LNFDVLLKYKIFFVQLTDKLCCSTTGNVNAKGRTALVFLTPNLSISAIIFVDDIMGIGDREVVEKIMRNCVQMETEKKWEFSIEKSNWMVMKTGKRNEEVQDIKVKVKQGEIERAEIYKYLGNWLNEQGNMDTQLQVMESRIGEIVRETNIIAGKEVVGYLEVQVKLFLYERTIISTMYYNIEAWSNIRKADEERMEVIQGKLIKKLLKLPKTTPYWGVLMELGIWPIKWQIVYKKLMLLHNLLNSDDDRTAKQVITEQRDNNEEECWYSEMRDVMVNLGIVRDPAEATKEEWKRKAKETISVKVKEEAEEKIRVMKKLRFCQRHGRKEYIDEMEGDDVIETMRIKLNMTMYISGNIGQRQTCRLCETADETTEHVFECTGIQNEDQLTTDCLLRTDKHSLLMMLKLFNKYKSAKEEMEREEQASSVMDVNIGSDGNESELAQEAK